MRCGGGEYERRAGVLPARAAGLPGHGLLALFDQRGLATSGSLADLDNNVPRALLDEAWVEADTYSLFEALMEGQLSDW